ncbi:hypothetical protein FGG08_004173 [Glutinoglossum americanum]|uniref:F-box domain-containing protein n=1 Tax=Glutinoglossum americanum TaxID=1670608 RepID=A0A9P8I828_9PEZI|nr:hypothetical protein FGG08_004173 [Glutinoglossum americanum]
MKLSGLLSTLRVPRADQRADSPMMVGGPAVGASIGIQRKRTMSVDEMLAHASMKRTTSTTDSFYPQGPVLNGKPLHHRKSSASLSTVANGVRRLLRRASTSFRTLGPSAGSNSDLLATPTSSTPRFRRASFTSGGEGWLNRPANAHHHHHHHPSLPFLSTVIDDEGVPALSFTAPIPGNGSEPPVVPDGNGGAAARAAAAAENERFKRLVVVAGDSKAERDAESGIGIELQEDGQYTQNHTNDTPVVRMDPMVFLPLEVMAYILSHLDHRSLLQAELVSHAWHRAASSHHVWRDIFRNEHRGDLPCHLSHYKSPGNSGKGLSKAAPNQDWKKMFSLLTELRRRWARGNVIGCYLSGHTDSVYCVQFDDDKIITGSRDQTIRVWDIRTGDCTKIIGPPPISSLGDTIASSPQSSTPTSRAITVQPSSKVSNNAVPQVYADGGIAATRTSPPEYHRASILCLQYDREILVTGSSDNTCIVWSIAEDYKPIRRLSQHTAGVLDVSFDASRIVSCSKDTTLCVWDRVHGELLHQLRGHRGPVNAVEVRGNLAASGSGDSLVKLWNLDSAACIREFDGHERGLACVQFSQDAQVIASGGNDDVICIWNANTGECVKKLYGHKHLIRALHLDSDNRRLISASYDMSIKVYDVETGRLMLDFPGWHTSWILSAKADYRRIVSTSQDRRMLILDFGAELGGVELLEG